MITMDKEGKAYFSVGDNTEDEKREIIDAVSEQKSLNLSDKEKQAFVRSGSMIGVFLFPMLKGISGIG